MPGSPCAAAGVLLRPWIPAVRCSMPLDLNPSVFVWKTQRDLQFPGRGHCGRRSLVLHLLLESVKREQVGRAGGGKGAFSDCVSGRRTLAHLPTC